MFFVLAFQTPFNSNFVDNHLYTLILDGHGDFSHFNIAQTAINASVRPVLCELKHQEGINLRDLFVSFNLLCLFKFHIFSTVTTPGLIKSVTL